MRSGSQPKLLFKVSGTTDAKKAGKNLATLLAIHPTPWPFITLPNQYVADPAIAPTPTAMNRDFPF